MPQILIIRQTTGGSDVAGCERTLTANDRSGFAWGRQYAQNLTAITDCCVDPEFLFAYGVSENNILFRPTWRFPAMGELWQPWGCQRGPLPPDTDTICVSQKVTRGPYPITTSFTTSEGPRTISGYGYDCQFDYTTWQLNVMQGQYAKQAEVHETGDDPIEWFPTITVSTRLAARPAVNSMFRGLFQAPANVPEPVACQEAESPTVFPMLNAIPPRSIRTYGPIVNSTGEPREVSEEVVYRRIQVYTVRRFSAAYTGEVSCLLGFLNENPVTMAFPYLQFVKTFFRRTLLFSDFQATPKVRILRRNGVIINRSYWESTFTFEEQAGGWHEDYLNEGYRERNEQEDEKDWQKGTKPIMTHPQEVDADGNVVFIGEPIPIQKPAPLDLFGRLLRTNGTPSYMRYIHYPTADFTPLFFFS